MAPFRPYQHGLLGIAGLASVRQIYTSAKIALWVVNIGMETCSKTQGTTQAVQVRLKVLGWKVLHQKLKINICTLKHD